MEKSNRRGLYIQQVEILGCGNFYFLQKDICFEENPNRNVNFDYFRQCWGVGGRCRKGKCLCSVNMHINIQGQCIGVIFFITSFLLDMNCTRICKICSKFTMWTHPLPLKAHGAILLIIIQEVKTCEDKAAKESLWMMPHRIHIPIHGAPKIKLWRDPLLNNKNRGNIWTGG